MKRYNLSTNMRPYNTNFKMVIVSFEFEHLLLVPSLAAQLLEYNVRHLPIQTNERSSKYILNNISDVAKQAKPEQQHRMIGVICHLI